MANTQDVLLDSAYDLKVSGGDFVVGESTAQHQNCILMAAKGDYKEFPMMGVDLMSWLNNERPEDMMRAIRLEFANDGMKVNRMKLIPPAQVTIDAEYK